MEPHEIQDDALTPSDGDEPTLLDDETVHDAALKRVVMEGVRAHEQAVDAVMSIPTEKGVRAHVHVESLENREG